MLRTSLPSNSVRVGLTGGIGSGKSEVARRFAALGAVVIDYDLLAREVVAPGSPGLVAVAAALGSEVVAANGSLDRAAVAALVFADDAARVRLNAVVHPLVGAAAGQRAAAAPLGSIVIHDIPLLVENGLAGGFDAVVVVLADRQTRIDRLVRLRGSTEDDVQRRMAAQADDDQRRAVATHVIVNDGDFAELERQVRSVWAALAAHVANR